MVFESAGSVETKEYVFSSTQNCLSTIRQVGDEGFGKSGRVFATKTQRVESGAATMEGLGRVCFQGHCTGCITY